jgi:predicted ATPase/DNA-binding SARP family transcriptional activator
MCKRIPQREKSVTHRDRQGHCENSNCESVMNATLQQPESSQLSIRLLGPFDVQFGGERIDRIHSRKEQWLLALLALRSGREVTREWLAGTLWPDSLKQQALAYLRRSLYLLKAALGDQSRCIQSPSAHSLCLDVSGAFVDVVAFDAAIARGDAASLRHAVTLYRGPLLEGCEEDWAVSERQAHELSFLSTLETLAELLRESGEIGQAISCLRRLVQADPLRESAHRALMVALAEHGDYAAMIQVYRELRLFLRREVNSEPSPETLQLLEQLRAHARNPSARSELPVLRNPATGSAAGSAGPVAPEAPPILDVPPRPDHPGVPRSMSPLIGREHEIREIKERLASAPLVTLTGTGGVGKTRIAVEVALGWKESEVWFVELAPLAATTLLEHVVAHAIGLKEQSGAAFLETLIGALATRHGLLILDNCEHLLSGCNELAMCLLQSCPHLRILATSRRSLGALGETVYPIGPLRTPSPGAIDAAREADQAEILLLYPAVQMFVDATRRLSPGLSLTPESASAVARICSQLDGIPLALELAVARSRVLSLEQICDRLSDRFQLLTSSFRPDVPHHLSLRATLEWSYELLTEPERRLFHRLSVFAGGWTLDLAEHICSDDESGENSVPDGPEAGERISHKQVLPILAALVNQSLVTFDPEGREPRYHMLETIRQYAAEKLANTGEAEEIQRRHCRLFLEFAEQGTRGVESNRQAECLRTLEADHDNLRAALRWSLTAESSPEIALRLCAAAVSLWKNYGYYREGAAWCEAAIARSPDDEPSAARAYALAALGTMKWLQGDLEGGYQCHLACLNLWRTLGDERAMAASEERVGALALRLGRPSEARERIEAAIEVARRYDDKFTLTHGLINLGCLEIEVGNDDLGRIAWEEALAISRAAGNDNMAAYPLGNLGYLAEQRGDYEEAWSLYSQSVDLLLKSGNKDGAAFMVLGMGTLAESQGEYEKSRSLSKDALRDWWKWGNRTNVLLAVERLAYILLSELKASASLDAWRYRQAALLMGAVEAERERLHCAPTADARAQYEAKLAQLNTYLGQDEMSRSWSEGREIPFDRVVRLALEID